MSDQITPLLEQLKKNEVLLQQIATTQVEALELSKKSLLTERYRVAIMGAKLLFIVILTWVSFVFLDDMIKGLMTSMGGSGGALELGGANELADQLKSSQDLMKEIMGR
ncbi:hypothetical protein GW756_02415 [bacterium]|nr:hypothetical protein [bacterium]NCQ55647.1 hypothetical protein [Candidatus Parcubacteria bacterium]NCS67472.1 hypothetical protein [Candidatus Peregrinibacteria bacterium]NCS96198.1 hypothetical protein [bacterium]